LTRLRLFCDDGAKEEKMSVKHCDRNGCDEIMCDILIDDRTYICDDCAEEFKVFVGTERMPKTAMAAAFVKFVASPKLARNLRGECSVGEFLTRDGTRG
jgi:hypothetical protein